MIRRFEIYSIRADAEEDQVLALETACRRCPHFIPEVLHSHMGWTMSDPAMLVWEHAFASPQAYQRYMVHPFHANVLDRYLLNDSPERVVIDNALGAGLLGYHCGEPVFTMDAGVRRLVLLRVDRGATPVDVQTLTEGLCDTSEDDHMILSVVGANTLGSAWFDGVTKIAGPPRWTHLWEQGFVGVDGLANYRDGDSAHSEMERRGWAGAMNGIVVRSISLQYQIDGPRPV